jgi:hypothetical protein
MPEFSSAELTKKSQEVDRYKPYTELCNKALVELGMIAGLPLRDANPHSLRLSRADPLPIKSTYASGECLERKPDLVHTSILAAIATHGSVDFGDEPTQSFEWPQVRSSVEMKAFAHGISNRAQLIVDGKQFSSGEGLPPIPWQNDFMFFEPLTQDETSNSSITSSTKSGSKRNRVTDDNDLTSSKKARLSNMGTDREDDKDTLKTVDARVQVAGYAKEMMSYSPGVVHVINILIIGQSSLRALRILFLIDLVQTNFSIFGITTDKVSSTLKRSASLLISLGFWSFCLFSNVFGLKTGASFRFSRRKCPRTYSSRNQLL